MYCPKCGSENPEGVKLCQSCSWVISGVSTVIPAEDAKTSALAITSLVLLILAPLTLCLTALPALIFGIIALVKIEKSNGRLKGRGFAIAGIAAPVVLIPVLAMLLAILMPALGKVKHLAQRMVCSTNLQGLGTAISFYSSDYDDKFPTGSKWCDLLIDNADVSQKSLVCPSALGGDRCSYVMNENAEKLGPDAPADMVLLFETSQPVWNAVGGMELLSTGNHKGEGCNVLYVDGSTEFVRTENIGTLRWTEEEPPVNIGITR